MADIVDQCIKIIKRQVASNRFTSYSLGRSHPQARPHALGPTPEYQTKLWARASVDGAKVSRKSNFIVMSYAVLDSGNTLATAGNKIIAIANTHEVYDTLQDSFSQAFADLNAISEAGAIITADGRSVPTEVFLGGDMKFILMVLSLSGAMANHACTWCKVHKNHRHETSHSWDFSSGTCNSQHHQQLHPRPICSIFFLCWPYSMDPGRPLREDNGKLSVPRLGGMLAFLPLLQPAYTQAVQQNLIRWGRSKFPPASYYSGSDTEIAIPKSHHPNILTPSTAWYQVIHSVSNAKQSTWRTSHHWQDEDQLQLAQSLWSPDLMQSRQGSCYITIRRADLVRSKKQQKENLLVAQWLRQHWEDP